MTLKEFAFKHVINLGTASEKGLHVIGTCRKCKSSEDCIIEDFFVEKFGHNPEKMGCVSFEAKE